MTVSLLFVMALELGDISTSSDERRWLSFLKAASLSVFTSLFGSHRRIQAHLESSHDILLNNGRADKNALHCIATWLLYPYVFLFDLTISFLPHVHWSRPFSEGCNRKLVGWFMLDAREESVGVPVDTVNTDLKAFSKSYQESSLDIEYIYEKNPNIL